MISPEGLVGNIMEKPRLVKIIAGNSIFGGKVNLDLSIKPPIPAEPEYLGVGAESPRT